MITCIGLSLSFDEVIFLPELNLNDCNRSSKITFDLGGKAVNVASVLSQLGVSSLFLGVFGKNSEDIVKKLLKRKEVNYELILEDGVSTRTDYVISEEKDGRSTLITGPDYLISENVLKKIRTKVEQLVLESSIIVFTGALPVGINKNYFSELTYIAKKNNCLTVIDSGFKELSNSLTVEPDFIMPNEQELSETIGYNPQNFSQLIEGANCLVKKGAKNVIVSMGDKGAVMVSKDKIVQAQSPKIIAKNTIGCGDAMLAGLISKLSEGVSKKEAFKYSVAIGAAAAMSESTSRLVSKEKINVLCDQVVIKSFDNI